MAPSPIAKQFLTNSVAHPEVKKSPEFHTRSPAVSWALINPLGPAANATSHAGLTATFC